MSAGNLILPSEAFRHFCSFINIHLHVYLSMVQLSFCPQGHLCPKAKVTFKVSSDLWIKNNKVIC